MNYLLENKIVVVIGGSSGIGKAVAERAAALGAALIIGGRNKERLEATARLFSEKGYTVQALQVDAHDRASLERFFAALPEMDHLVSMVGDVMGGGFLEPSEEVIRHVIESKFFTNLVIGRLAAAKLRQGGSLIFTSGSGGSPTQASAAYIGNMAIRTMAEGLAKELAPRVRVNTVAPFWMDTPFWKNQPADQVQATKADLAKAIPLGRTGTIEEVAAAYLYLIQNTFVTGQQLFVDGGVMLV